MRRCCIAHSRLMGVLRDVCAVLCRAVVGSHRSSWTALTVITRASWRQSGASLGRYLMLQATRAWRRLLTR